MTTKAGAMSNNFVQRKRIQQLNQYKNKIRKFIEDFMNCDIKFLFVLVEIMGFSRYKK